MDLVDNIKKIEQYLCENFEEWDLDDPIEEEYYAEYEGIKGADEDQIRAFEQKFGICLPEDMKALYRYKNGSRLFTLFPTLVRKSEFTFSLMSLEEIEDLKEHFQNKDALLEEFHEYFTPEDIHRMKDPRIQPYLFHKEWLPFAQYCGSCYLMLDFAPDKEGKVGQIICYIHDPDEIVYVSESLSTLILEIVHILDL